MEFAATNVRCKRSFESEDHYAGNVSGTDLCLTRIVVEVIQSPQHGRSPVIRLSLN